MGFRIGANDSYDLSEGVTLTSKRFFTEWTSEDFIVYRLYIIPSDADYSSGSQDLELPNDFLLRDMKLDSSIGELPTGLKSDVLKLSVNIASLQGTAELNNLREQLLKGTSTKLIPRNSNGTAYLENMSLQYHTAPTLEEREFNVFNTFVLLYNDSFGFNPTAFSPLFIGCQKFSAENELEISSLENLISYSVELFDITRCIGEVITPTIWKAALAVESDAVEYRSGLFRGEREEYRDYLIGTAYNHKGEAVNLVDTIESRFWSYVTTFKKLTERISTLYSAYLRAILRNNSCSFTAPRFYQNAMRFRDLSGVDIGADYLCYIAEIWESSDKNGIRLVSGAHADSTMFAQYGNFHEVLKSLIEGNGEIVRVSYSRSSGNPDSYSVTLSSYYPYGNTSVNTKEFNQANTYSNLKIKLFSEALKSAKISVSSINGDRDTTEYKWEEQGTSGDNSKDLKIMFHNLPILTNRDRVERINSIWQNENRSYVRGTVNPGYILYFDSAAPNVPIKADVVLKIYFDADSLVPPATPVFYWLPSPVIYVLPNIDAELKCILEQQNGGLATTYCYALVESLGNRKQAEAELTTTQVECYNTRVGERVKVNLSNYNSLLQSIYNSSIVKGVLLEHSHDVFRGTADLKIRIDAE